MKSTLWLGTQNSYDEYLASQAQTLARFGDREDEYSAKLMEVHGTVGVISIKGSLVDGHAGYMSYFGVVGYGDIRDALVAGLQNPSVQSILLDVGSGGGAVNGCHETAELIQRVSKFKPVVTYTGGTMASAALWCGCGAEYIVASPTATVGSIGIITIHAERSKQLEQDGVKVTVIRAGADKALATPYEPLSEKARAALEERAASLYDIFIGHVAQARNTSLTSADTKFGQGREFLAKDAKAAGLIDEVGFFEQAYEKAVALGTKAAAKSQKQGMRAEASDNIADVSANSQTEVPPVSNNPTNESEAAEASNAQGTDMTLPLTQADLAAMVGIPAEQASTEATAPAAAELQVAELTAQVASLTAQVLAATEATAAQVANTEALATIVRGSIKTMAIALGTEAKSEDLAVSAVAAEHGRMAALFTAKIKVGGVSATNTFEKPEGKPASQKVDPLFAYAVKSLN